MIVLVSNLILINCNYGNNTYFLDASDETNCNRNTTCDPWMFSCGDGKCIYKTWTCKMNLMNALDCKNNLMTF